MPITVYDAVKKRVALPAAAEHLFKELVALVDEVFVLVPAGEQNLVYAKAFAAAS